MWTEVTIQPAVLRWALNKTGLSPDELDQVFPHHHKWQEGSVKPTLPQARKLADKAHIPFARLLLDEPSGEEVSLPDFRTVAGA